MLRVYFFGWDLGEETIYDYDSGMGRGLVEYWWVV